MGRKPKDREITYKNFIGIKLSDQQLEYLQTRAKRLGVSQSEYIRRLLTDKPLQIRYAHAIKEHTEKYLGLQ